MARFTDKELREMPDYIVRYLAPMRCMEEVRAEAVRREVQKGLPMQRELLELCEDHKMLPKGTRIKTTSGGVHTGGTHELTADQLASANKVPNVLSDCVPFWILGWKDLHKDLLLPRVSIADIHDCDCNTVPHKPTCAIYK